MTFPPYKRPSDASDGSKVSVHFHNWLRVRAEVEKLSNTVASLEHLNGCECPKAEAVWDRDIAPLVDQLASIQGELVEIRSKSDIDILMKIVVCLDAGACGNDKHFRMIWDEASKRLAVTV